MQLVPYNIPFFGSKKSFPETYGYSYEELHYGNKYSAELIMQIMNNYYKTFSEDRLDRSTVTVEITDLYDLKGNLKDSKEEYNGGDPSVFFGCLYNITLKLPEGSILIDIATSELYQGSIQANFFILEPLAGKRTTELNFKAYFREFYGNETWGVGFPDNEIEEMNIIKIISEKDSGLVGWIFQ